MSPAAMPRRGSAREVFTVFLKLGLISFGGPIAHLGYFRTEFVERRQWLDDRAYTSLVGLCQFLPGPASSQVGFAIGLQRAGGLGALAAFVAFTLPSATLMLAFASGAALVEGPVADGVLNGLKLVAVAIVAEAVLGMARNLTPDRKRAAIAVIAATAALLLPSTLGQLAAIAVGAAAGVLFCRTQATDPLDTTLRFSVRRRTGVVSLVLLGLLLVGGPLLVTATGSDLAALFDAFFRSGALVFGGGHVVLPLLETAVVAPGWVSHADFLAGYGVAQAAPGPLFSFAGYLGAVSSGGPGGAFGALVALVAVFAPGFLLLVGGLPFWSTLTRRPAAQALIRGANAAVVGILAAALYSPVFTTAVTSPGAFCIALACFVLRTAWKLPPWAVVVIGAAGGALLSLASGGSAAP